MTPQELRNMANAAEALGLKIVPEEWFKLIADGWKIRAADCHCGGEWLWVAPNASIFGCVCHHQMPRRIAA